MSSTTSRAKIAAASVAILGVALSVFLLRQDPPAPAPSKPMAELSHIAAASPPAPVPAAAPVREPARAVPTTARVAPEAPGSKRALSFEVPDCPDLTLVSVANTNPEGTVATVRTGDSEPDEVRVGDLLESGEVTFVGMHPESGAPIVLLEDHARVACRAVGLRPLAALRRVGSASQRDFAARSTVTGDPNRVTGDPNRVETMALKLPPGTNAARADFGPAERKR
jgi:hypothetical protein